MKKTTKFFAVILLLTAPVFYAVAQGTSTGLNAGATATSPVAVQSQSYLGADLDYSSGSAKVTFITPETPAERASFKKGDVINSIGSITIASQESYNEAMKTYKPGEDVKISFTRNGKAKQRTVTLDKISVTN